MENKIKKAINDFISDEELEYQKEIKDNKKKHIKTDNTIIERVNKIIIDESGRQLLREQY